MSILAFVLTIGFPWTDHSEQWRWAILAVGAPIVMRSVARLRGECTVWLAGVFCWSTVSVVLSSARWTSVGELAHLLILAGVTAAVTAEKSIRPAMLGLAAGITVNGVVFLAQLWLGWRGIPQAECCAGLLYNRDFLGEASALVGVWMFVAASCAEWQRVVVSSLLVFVGLVVASGSRVAVLALGCGLLCRLRGWARALVVVLIAATVVGFSYRTGKLASFAERLHIWRFAAEHVSVFGCGLGCFEALAPRVAWAHSDVLQSAVEIGIVPTIVLSGWAYVLLVGFPRRFCRDEYRQRHRDSSDCRNDDRSQRDGVSGASGREDARAAMERRATEAALLAGMVEIGLAFPLHLPLSGFILALLVGDLARRRDGVR